MSLLLYAACIDCQWTGNLENKDDHEQSNPGHLVVIRDEEVPCGCS